MTARVKLQMKSTGGQGKSKYSNKTSNKTSNITSKKQSIKPAKLPNPLNLLDKISTSCLKLAFERKQAFIELGKAIKVLEGGGRNNLDEAILEFKEAMEREHHANKEFQTRAHAEVQTLLMVFDRVYEDHCHNVERDFESKRRRMKNDEIGVTTTSTASTSADKRRADTQ